MSGKIWLFLAVCLVSAASACAYFALTIQPPGLYAEPPTLDLGQVGQGETIPVRFKLVNRFDQTVEIKGITRQCGCTQVVAEKQRLEPGDETAIVTKWQTGKARGLIDLSLWVVFGLDDQRESNVRLNFVAEVIPDIHYTPSKIRFEGGGSRKTIIRFSPGRLSLVLLSEPYCSHNAFAAKLLPDGTSVQVTFNPDDWPTSTVPNVYLSVPTNSPTETICHIPMYVDFNSSESEKEASE